MILSPNELGRRGGGVVVLRLPLLDDLREVAEPQHALLLALARHLARYPVPPLLAPLGELRQRRLQRDLQSLQSILLIDVFELVQCFAFNQSNL